MHEGIRNDRAQGGRDARLRSQQLSALDDLNASHERPARRSFASRPTCEQQGEQPTRSTTSFTVDSVAFEMARDPAPTEIRYGTTTSYGTYRGEASPTPRRYLTGVPFQDRTSS